MKKILLRNLDVDSMHILSLGEKQQILGGDVFDPICCCPNYDNKCRGPMPDECSHQKYSCD